MTKTITTDELTEGLKKIVAEFGEDHQYEAPEESDGCQYWHPRSNEPGCLIGVFLDRFGVDSETLAAMDEWGGIGVASPVLAKKADVVFEPEALSLAREVQMQQDNGRPWGEALSTGLWIEKKKEKTVS